AVAHLALVVLVVRVILLRAAHGLLEQRVRKAPLDLDRDSLVLLRAGDDAPEHSFRHDLSHLLLAAPAAFFSRATVFIFAMSRRMIRTREVFSSWPVARWKRRLNCSFFSLRISSSS